MKLSFKPYKRRLKTPIKMSRGIIDFREGIILRLETVDSIAYSEVVVLDYFKTESLEESLKILASLPAKINAQDLQLIPQDYLATRFAFEALFFKPIVNRKMSVSKLLPAGSAAISELKNGIKQGFATFKWKIGSDQGEFEIFQELLGISGKVKFRLDANAGLHLDLAKKWLRLCEDKPVEFIEQPLAVSEFEQMRYLSKEFKTPIALDESVARLCDLKSTESKGWQGLYVVKPFRLGNLKDFLTWRELGDKKIVYSSALETIFGTDVALKIAATDNNNDFALGFGVSHFFESDGLSLDTSSAEIVVGQDYALEALWQKSSLY